VQQFLAYEKCYKITGGYQNCIAAHEPLSYTDKYPITKNSWTGPGLARMARAWPRSHWRLARSHAIRDFGATTLRQVVLRRAAYLVPAVSF
jgi:hypothetical protein